MRSRIPKAIWNLWINVCAALLILAVLEGAAQVASGMRQQTALGGELREFESHLRAGAPSDADWVAGYMREFAQIQTAWRPYVYWRVQPYQGNHINVDKEGLRRTWNSVPAPSREQRKIFILGGSTLWGMGARDEFTIPSLVSKRLDQMGVHTWVTNLGEIGWVNTQEVIALILELQQGNVPDVVVFYGGFNDVYSAYQNRTAGLPQNERHRVAEFNLISSGDLRPIVLHRLALYRWSERVAAGIRRSRGQRFSEGNAASTDSLVNAIVDIYVRNIELVEALSGRYRFKAYFFWQPALFTKRNLSPEEKRALGTTANAPAALLHAQVKMALGERTKGYTGFHDLADVFGDDRRTVFIDWVHMLESGNQRVAEEIVRVLHAASADASR